METWEASEIEMKTETLTISGQLVRLATIRQITVNRDKSKVFYRDARGRAKHVKCSSQVARDVLDQLLESKKP